MPTPAEPLYNPYEWFRPGGHRLTFLATRDELQELLDVGLPGALAPWHLTGADLVPRPDQPDRYSQSPWASSQVDLSTASGTPTARSRTKLFVWSEQLTSGELPREPGSNYEGLCAFNGFLLIQLGGQDNLSRIRASSLSIVDRFVNMTSGEERRYPEYLRVFNRLRRLVRKRLIAPSVLTIPNGAEYVDADTKWTTGAVAAHADGVRFTNHNRPCRPLESARPPD